MLNPRRQFPPERFAAIESSRAKAIFTSVADLGIDHPRLVRFRLGQRGGTALEAPG